MNAPLPAQTETYTVISHGAIIDKTKQMLAEKGFEIERELYRCTEGAKVAQGVYHLKYGDDPDMSMMFAWSNSYDKSMRFKCSIGAYVHVSLASIIGSNMGNYGRRHVGTADNEVMETIAFQIENAEAFFKQLVQDKEKMKNLHVSENQRAKLVGQLYFVHELLNSEQMSTIRNEFNKPSFTYTGIDESVWAMYNTIVYALQKSHPKTWMDQQTTIHYLLCKLYEIPQELVISEPAAAVQNQEPVVKQEEGPHHQMTLPEMIEQVEAENIEKHSTGLVASHDNGQTILPETNESPEVMLEEAPVIAETITGAPEDNSWPCLKCGEVQGLDALWNEGQLCTKCANEQA